MDWMTIPLLPLRHRAMLILMPKPTENSLISLSKSAQTWWRLSRVGMERQAKTMQRARWVAITSPLYSKHLLKESKRGCGVRKSRGMYTRRRVEGSTKIRSSGLACRSPESLPLTTSSDSDTYSPCTIMERCVVETLKESAVQVPCKTMSNVDRTKKIRREVEVPKANLRVTYGDMAILTSWTLTTTITPTMTVEAVGVAAGVVGVTKVVVKVVEIIKETPTTTLAGTELRQALN